MEKINSTNHWSRIVNSYDGQPFFVFKHSSSCPQSHQAYKILLEAIKKRIIIDPVFLIVIQENPEVSKLITNYLKVKHESPQLILVLDGRSLAVQNHLINFTEILKHLPKI